MRQIWLSSLLIVFLAEPTSASSQSDKPADSQEHKRTESAEVSTDSDQAKVAFERGKQLYTEKKYVEAANAFRVAYHAKPTWRLLYNIGQSEAAAKRLGLALEAFEGYLAEGGDEIPLERQQEVRSEIKRIRELVGMLDISAVSKATITVDGTERGRAPLPGMIPVTAGIVHEIKATLGDVVETRMVKVTGGQTIVVELGKEKQPSQEAAPDSPVVTAPTEGTQINATSDDSTPPSSTTTLTRSNGRTMRIAGWSIAGAGAALLVGGAATGTLALVEDNKIVNGCDNGQCDPSWKDNFDKRDTLGMTTNIVLAVGGVTAMTGILLLVLAPKQKKKGSDLSVQPQINRKSSGVSITWNF